jgi:hypothetical protein
VTREEAQAICREVERTMWRIRLRRRLSPRHFWFQVKRRFPNIEALKNERSDLRAELVQDRDSCVREVIRELDQDIASARAVSWPCRFKRFVGVAA